MKFTFFTCLLCTVLFCSGQNASIYRIYETQLSKLLATRGMGTREIENVLMEYAKMEINSNEDFAEILGSVYPPNKGIAVIVYFFNADTLTRVLFEPGEVKSIDKINITADELTRLKIDLLGSLRVYEKSNSRKPKKRGVEESSPPVEKISLPVILQKATEILVPRQFNEKYSHLVVVPSLNIGAFPFHLLKPYRDSSYLIDKCSFSIAPSLLDIIVLRGDYLKSKRIGNLLVNIGTRKQLHDSAQWKNAFPLVNPLFISNPAYPVNDEYYFPNLPGAAAEIGAALKYARKYTLLKGTSALKSKVIQEMEGRDLVYFATHGLASEDEPMKKSFLVLSGADPYLTAKEIMDLYKTNYKFPKMVILSACQTGLGKYMEAGIAGLARPFLICGSKHVMMSLWNVDDKATAFLMSRFMYHLSVPNLHMPSGPLRLAILDTKKKFTNPVYWASFSAFGVDY